MQHPVLEELFVEDTADIPGVLTDLILEVAEERGWTRATIRGLFHDLGEVKLDDYFEMIDDELAAEAEEERYTALMQAEADAEDAEGDEEE